MKMAAILGYALLAAQPATTPVPASDQVNNREEVTIDPAKAYIFFRTTERPHLRFLREVTPEEQAAWEAARAAAFARNRERYPRRFEVWRREDEACRRNPTPACQNGPPRPADYTLETFPFPPAEADNFLDLRPGRHFSRNGDDYTYLMAVQPGTYILYGEVAETPNGNVGTCLCMGSLKFEAQAGRIVDVGEIRYPGRKSGGEPASDAVRSGRPAFQAITPAAPSLPVPARLAGLPLYPASLRAADKMPNYFGVLIDRIEALPGVLAYRRDLVVDLRAQAAEPAPTGN